MFRKSLLFFWPPPVSQDKKPNMAARPYFVFFQQAWQQEQHLKGWFFFKTKTCRKPEDSAVVLSSGTPPSPTIHQISTLPVKRSWFETLRNTSKAQEDLVIPGSSNSGHSKPLVKIITWNAETETETSIGGTVDSRTFWKMAEILTFRNLCQLKVQNRVNWDLGCTMFTSNISQPISVVLEPYPKIMKYTNWPLTARDILQHPSSSKRIKKCKIHWNCMENTLPSPWKIVKIYGKYMRKKSDFLCLSVARSPGWIASRYLLDPRPTHLWATVPKCSWVRKHPCRRIAPS